MPLGDPRAGVERDSSPPERLLNTVQPEPQEGIGMDVEELHAFFEPVRQLIGGHQRAGDLAGGADLVDGERHLIDDGLRPWLAGGWRRRESGRTIAAPPAPRMTCAAFRTSSKPQAPCSQSTKIESAPSSTSRAERPGETWCGLNMVIASPFDRRSRSFAPFMAVPSGLSL